MRRQSAHLRKRRFTQKQAIAEVVRIKAKPGAADTTTLHHYRCHEGGRWHWHVGNRETAK